MNTSLPSGLTTEEITFSRKEYGSNKTKGRGFVTEREIIGTVFSPFNILMFTLITILVFINQLSTAFFIGFIAIVNTLIALVQQLRARMVIRRLHKLSERNAKVIRQLEKGTQLYEIPIDDLVLGDTLFFSRGDRVLVDGEIVLSTYAEFDESILTGESKYVAKKQGEEVHAGSFLVAGSCYIKMTKLTKDSYIQTITQHISKEGLKKSPLQSDISRIITVLTYMTIFFILLVVGEGIFDQNQKAEVILNSATLVTSLVPQGLVLITTISFAFGATQMAKRGAIVQRLSAIEAMAHTHILCMDKTGTLTKDTVEVKDIRWMNEHEE